MGMQTFSITKNLVYYLCMKEITKGCAEELQKQPANTVFVLMSNRERAATEACKVLAA
jgi:hypothetical protein